MLIASDNTKLAPSAEEGPQHPETCWLATHHCNFSLLDPQPIHGAVGMDKAVVP